MGNSGWDDWGWGGGGGCPPPCPPAPYPPPQPGCYPPPACTASPCPPVAVPPCPPPWYGPPRPPWYPGANGGVSFGATPPQFPIRGHLWWDGATLHMWDGVQWETIGPTAPSAGGSGIPEAPTDGQTYARKNGAWVVVPARVIQQLTVFYTSSQTITIPAGATQAYVSMWGATGGSGGGNNTDSGGTGAGGYLEKLLTGLVPGNTLVFTQGQGGAAGAPAAAGGNATATTLVSGTQTIGALTCNGSLGSAAGVAGGAMVPGTPGGTASGGDFNMTGQSGGNVVPATAENAPAVGGVTFFSMGAAGVSPPGSAPGNPGNPGGLKIAWTITG